MANEPRLLYELTDFFRLIYGGQNYYINEPEGWDKINIKLAREKELYGFNYEFVDPNINLVFPWKQGGSLIKGVYDLAGSDGEIVFHYGYERGGEKLLQYAGRINLNTFSELDYGVELQIEKVLFNNLIRTRYETKVSLPATVDLNGNAAPAAPSLSIGLHSKRIIKTARGESIAPADQVPTSIGTMSKFYLLPDTQSTVKSELEELFQMPAAISNDAPETADLFQFQVKETGFANINFSYRFYLTFTRIVGFSIVTTWGFTAKITVKRAGNIVFSKSGPTPTGTDTTGNPVKAAETTVSVSAALMLEIGDEVYCYAEAVLDRRVLTALLNWTSHVEITQETSAAASTVLGYKILDALNNVAHKITGTAAPVLSDFFGPGGGGERYLLTNGFKLRNFAEEKPFQLSLKDGIEGAAAIWNIGVQQFQDENGLPKIRMEPAAHFFGSERIQDFTEIYDLRIGHEKDVTYNEIEIGYAKFSEAEINTLDEFNTTHSYLLPIETYKAKYVQKCNWIASGYLIEEIRRDQFAKSPSKSLSNDDDIFIVSYWWRQVFDVVRATANGEYLSIEAAVNLQAGESFTVETYASGSGSALTARGTYTVVSKEANAQIYRVTPAFPSAFVLFAKLTLSTGAFVAERNEAFEIVENVISPETSYNLRLSPKRMLYNHSGQLNIPLEKKPASAQIRHTYGKSNNELRTRFREQADHKLTEENYTLKEKDPVTLSDFNARKAFYAPKTATFKTEIRYNDLIHLKNCLLGQTGTAKDYGTIGFPNGRGGWLEGYVWALDYNPEKKEATFTVRIKGNIQ